MSTNPNYLVLIQQYGSPGSTSPAISVQAPIPEQVIFDLDSTYEPLLPQGFTNNAFLRVASAGMGVRLAVQALTAQLWTGSTTGDLAIPLEFHTETDPVNDVRNPIVNMMKLVTPSISSSTGMMQSPGPQLNLSQLGSIASDAVSSTLSTVGQFGSSVGSTLKSVVSNAFGISSSNPQQAQMVDTNQQSTDGANSAVPKALQQNPQLGTAEYWKSQITNRISIRIGNYLYFDNVVITGMASTFMSAMDATTGLPHHVQVNLRFRPMFVLSQSDIDNVYINPNGNSTPGTSNYGFSIPGGSGSDSYGVGSNTYGFTT